MKQEERVSAFSKLGIVLRDLKEEEKRRLAGAARAENPWFVQESVEHSLKGVTHLLREEELVSWAHRYEAEPSPRTVGVAMAGNIPLVGFHDLLCVLISGHKILYKASHKDTVLVQFVIDQLQTIEPGFKECIAKADRLKDVDALLATGGDNTYRYFEYYFRKIKHIIRKNRSSCAVLNGSESKAELELLGNDIFTYFGLGCRNVSQILLPEGYDVNSMAGNWSAWSRLMDCTKYANNYHRHRTVALMNGEEFVDIDFALLKRDDALVSPLATVHLCTYKNQAHLDELLKSKSEKIQAIVSGGWIKGSVPFGSAQLPGVSDYADGVDTMKFLAGLG